MESNGHLSYDSLLEELKKSRGERERWNELQSKFLLEIQALNTKLMKAEHVKSAFLSNIRNEIINPLASILGLSEKIAQDTIDVELYKKLGKLLNKEAYNLDFQICNIVAAAEIEAGIIEPVAVVTRIEDLINDQVKSLSFLSHERNVTVSVAVNCEENSFTTDPGLFRLIVTNLVANAIKFSQPQQKVFVSADCINKKLLLQVEDSGTGISPEEQKNIFDRFNQEHKGSAKTHHGHGLGLSIVKEFTDILRGTLLIESNEGGTKVIITLPWLNPDLLEDGFISATDEIMFGDEEIL
jgi:signal transduction histidine kinase